MLASSACSLRAAIGTMKQHIARLYRAHVVSAAGDLGGWDFGIPRHSSICLLHAVTNASISCPVAVSSGRHSGCHCTPTQKRVLPVPHIASIVPSSARAATRKHDGIVAIAWWWALFTSIVMSCVLVLASVVPSYHVPCNAMASCVPVTTCTRWACSVYGLWSWRIAVGGSDCMSVPPLATASIWHPRHIPK